MMPADQHSPQSVQADKPASSADIQADKPLPPWEMPDSFRLDCAPHRGGRLFCAATVSMVFAIHNALLLTLYFALDASGDAPVSTPVALGSTLALVAALLVGLATYVLARRDLTRMQRGLMDRGGEKRTREARDMSRAVLWICPLAGVLVLGCRLAGWMVGP